MPPGRLIVLVMHKPLTARGAQLAAAPPYRFIPLPARQQLERQIRPCTGDPCRVLRSHNEQIDASLRLWPRIVPHPLSATNDGAVITSR